MEYYIIVVLSKKFPFHSIGGTFKMEAHLKLKQ